MSTNSFSKALIDSLQIETDGIEDLQAGQDQNLELFKKQNVELESLKLELEDITLVFSKLPEYQEKLDVLKKDMNFVSKKGVEVRERAKEVERMKHQRKLADEKLLAQPSTSIGNTTVTATTTTTTTSNSTTKS